jgi:tetraacyldisaccharide 4'-kinase
VVAAAGIANPQRFFTLLAALGAHLVTTVPMPDHHVLSSDQTCALLRRARAQRAVLILTAKDVVKLPAALADEVAWLEIEAVPLEGGWLDLLRNLLPAAAPAATP